MAFEIERLKQTIDELQSQIKQQQTTINEYKKQNELLQQEVDKLTQINNDLITENKTFKNKIIELEAEKIQMNEEWEKDLQTFSEIFNENDYLNKRVNELEMSYNTINNELKRMKQKFIVSDLSSFMNLYGKIMERGDIKIIQKQLFNETGLKYTETKLKDELTEMGYQITKINRTGVSYYVSKSVKGFLYINQLNKHIDTDIYKVGRTVDMRQRMKEYKQHNSGANVLVCKPVSNQFKAEVKLLSLLNEAVENNLLKHDTTGKEYFSGSFDFIKNIYDQVVEEFADENDDE